LSAVIAVRTRINKISGGGTLKVVSEEAGEEGSLLLSGFDEAGAPLGAGFLSTGFTSLVCAVCASLIVLVSPSVPMNGGKKDATSTKPIRTDFFKLKS
jgi:hypothetical protein